MKMRRARAGFTLVEMLVVISITIVLLGLILGPVIQVFNMTKEAHAMVTAQDTARFTLEQVSRELGQAMFVYDNSNSTLVFPCTDSTGATVTPQAPFAKIDIIIPKGVMHCNNPSHPASDPRDYERGDEAWPPCPYCASTDVEFRPVEPLTQDSKIVRYFVGLADPSTPRDWEDAGPPANGFVLYRAEFDPYEKNLVDQGPNGPILDDPNFFYGTHMAAWKAIAKPVGPKKDVDLVVLKTDPATNAIISAESSVRFRLTQITNDSFSPAYVTDFASDTPAAIPTVFRASYGSWGASSGTTTPDMYNVSLVRYNPTTGANDIWYRTGWDSSTPPHLMLYKWGTAAPILDLTVLKNDLETKGVTTFQPPNPEVAFIVDPVRGEARFDFPKSDVINQAEIDTMNQNVIGNWGSKTNGPVRRHQIPLGATATYVPRIVPGSEVVRGPDMTPGLPDYMIKMVRYERVPLALIKPGRNQYTIDYGLGLDSKPGEITFSSLSDEQIPLLVADPPNGTKPGSIEIKYRFQVNHDGDVVVGNYATKTLLTVTLGIRFYDSNSGKVHPVELTNKVRVRNLMR